MTKEELKQSRATIIDQVNIIKKVRAEIMEKNPKLHDTPDKQLLTLDIEEMLFMMNAIFGELRFMNDTTIVKI